MDELALKLNSPITDEQWDIIADTNFDHTNRIWFHTKNGKDVEFVKVVYEGDCISRQATNSLVDELARSLSDRRSGLNRGRDPGEIMEDILRLPSVQPDRKKGHWIRISNEPFADTFECSECSQEPPIRDFEWYLSDYCPNCGADMRDENSKVRKAKYEED